MCGYTPSLGVATNQGSDLEFRPIASCVGGAERKLEIPCYHVDAFSNRPFEGNPAAVCLLREWLEDAVLGAIAGEFNLSETAFVKRQGEGWAIRWFTPACEVDLCGHATLAAAHILFSGPAAGRERIEFSAGIGRLAVAKQAPDRLELDFPSQPPRAIDPPPRLVEGLGVAPDAVLLAEDLLCVYPDEATVRAIKPDYEVLLGVPGRGVIVTAHGDGCDFVSRFFGPKVGVPEDPVTGSAHTSLVPYWSAQLGRRMLLARQVSARGGTLWLSDRGERIGIAGCAVTVAAGALRIA